MWLYLHLYIFITSDKLGVIMPERVQRMFCTMFKKTEEEQKNYDARVELAKAKDDLETTKESLAVTTETLNKAMQMIESLSSELSSIREELKDTKEGK
jgi:hypothetical protein